MTSPAPRLEGTSQAPSLPKDGRDVTPGSAAAFGATDLMLVAMAVIWGVNYSVIKYGTIVFPPLAFNGVRIPIAAAIQLLAARAERGRIAAHDKWRLIALGMLGNGVYQVLFILGIARTRVATAALLMAATPAMIAVIGWLGHRERIHGRAWSGILLQVVGIATVVLGTAGSRSGEDSLLGVALILIGSLSWAWYSILIRSYTERVPPIALGGYTMLGGAIVAVVFAIPVFGAVAWTTISLGTVGAIAFSSIFALVFAYLFWYRGVQHLGAVRTAMYGNLQPLIAMVVAWLALGEFPTAWQLAGAASIMTGLILARAPAPSPRAIAGTPD